MKKYTLFILGLFIYFLPGNAQKDIEVKIEKLIKGEELYLKMTIINNNPYGIGIMNFVNINPDGQYADTNPTTSMTLIGSPVSINYESLATINLKQHFSLKNGLTYTDRGNRISNAQLTAQVRNLIDSVARVSYSSGVSNSVSSGSSQGKAVASSTSTSSTQSTSASVSSQLIYKIESNPVIFSGTLENDRLKAMKAEYMEAGGTFTDEVKVFGNHLPNPYVGFEYSDAEYIKSLQLKLKLTYYYLGDKEAYTEYFYSNIITL